MNDLFYLLKGVCINAYADDEQIYASGKDPVNANFSKLTNGLVWMVWLQILINIKQWF